MKSPLKKSIGEVVTDYGTKVMRILKKRLQRSLFDFYGDVKADNLRTRETVNPPTTPVDGDGGVIYTKAADGKLYYKSNEVAEVELSAADTVLTSEQVQDIVGAMFSSNTETNITVTYQDADGTIDLVATDTNTQLTTEEVQDIVGAMFSGNTETRISATYEDSDGTIDLVVNDIPVDLTVSVYVTIHTDNEPTLNQITTCNAATATLATNAQGITGATDADVTITSDGEVIVKLDSDNDEGDQKFKITNNADTEIASISEGGDFYVTGDITNSGSDNDLTINSDGNMNFVLDRDNDETSQSFSFKNFNVEVANLDESGNLQIDGDLTVSGNDIKDSGGNSIISSDGSGVVTMAAGNIAVGGSNANINMNAGSDIVLEADNAGGSGASSIQYLDAGSTNRIMLAANSDVVILSNRAANGTVQIRANTSSAGGGGEVTVVTVEDDKVTISQDLDVTGNVLPGITYVKILPSDFVPDDAGRPAMIDDTGSDRWLESHGTAKLFASVDIPPGFKATHVDIYGSATSAVTVYEADVNSKTVTSKGTGNIGTQINMTDVNSDATNYILIELAQASGEEVYGGKLTIAKI